METWKMRACLSMLENAETREMRKNEKVYKVRVETLEDEISK